MPEITRKFLLSVPKREWNKTIRGASCAYIISSGRKHDSGYACMDMVACIGDGENMVRFGGWCDDVSLIGDAFRMDCVYPSRIIRIWNKHKFSISHDASSIEFVQEKAPDNTLYEIYKSLLR